MKAKRTARRRTTSRAKASIKSAMTKRLGVQPSSGINGSPHGTNGRKS